MITRKWAKYTGIVTILVILFVAAGLSLQPTQAQADGTWSQMNSGTNQALFGIWGNSSTDVFAVGVVNNVVHYNGSSWTPMTLPTGALLGGVWGSSGSDVFAVGLLPEVFQRVLHYDGSSWSVMNSGAGARLRSVWGTSSSDVFAVGDSGSIIHYDGYNWSLMTGSSTTYLGGVWGSSGSDVFAVGTDFSSSEGVILHYDGSTWSPTSSGTTTGLAAVWGNNAGDVFAVGGLGTIMHYNGTNWSQMTGIPTTSDLYAIWGSGPNDVFAAGYQGTILHYDGTNWSTMNSGTTVYLNGVWGSGTDNVFAVGDQGTILHYGASGTISGRILRDGQPAPNEMVVLYDLGKTPNTETVSYTNSQGVYQFNNLPNSTYSVNHDAYRQGGNIEEGIGYFQTKPVQINSSQPTHQYQDIDLSFTIASPVDGSDITAYPFGFTWQQYSLGTGYMVAFSDSSHSYIGHLSKVSNTTASCDGTYIGSSGTTKQFTHGTYYWHIFITPASVSDFNDIESTMRQINIMPALAWLHQFGGTGEDWGITVAADDNGNAYVGGVSDTPLPGQTVAGPYVRKYNSSGMVLWTDQFQFAGTDGGWNRVQDITIDKAGSVYAAGAYRTNAFVRKYDNLGNLLWAHQYGGEANGIAVDVSGNVYVAGLITGGGNASSIRKYDSLGNEMWTVSGIGTWPYAIDVDGNGNVFVAGGTAGTLPGQTSSGSDDAFVCKLDGSGALLWTRQFGTSSDDNAWGIAIGPSGNAYVCGEFGSSAFIKKYDSQGNELWSQQSGTNISYHRGIAVDKSENIYVAVSAHFIDEYDSSGNKLVTIQPPPGSPYIDTYGVAVNAERDIYVTGYVLGAFPGETSFGYGDAFIMRFAGPYNTTSGTDVIVEIPNSDTGNISPVTANFSSITNPGGTSATISSSGPDLPVGFMLGQPPTFFDITTTATYAGTIIVSVNHSDITFDKPQSELRLLQMTDAGWQDITLLPIDTMHKIIYGETTHLSWFVVAQHNDPPVINSLTANPNQLWPPNNKVVSVTIAVTVSDPNGPADIDRITYSVADEYGVYNVPETILPSNGVIGLVAARDGNDKDGRTYKITVKVYDQGGLSDSRSVVVVVPHDQRK